MTRLLLLLSLLALVVTKIADILTTIRGVGRMGSVDGEGNPFARFLMRRCGLIGGMVLVMVLWCLVVAACYFPAWFAPTWYQIVTTLGGLLIACAQADVARANATGRHSAFTCWMQGVFYQWRTRYCNRNLRSDAFRRKN